MRAISLMVLLVFLGPTACGKDESGRSAKSSGDDDDDKPKKKKKKKRDDEADCEAIYEKETECNGRKMGLGKRKKQDRDRDKKRDDDDEPESEKDEFLTMCKAMLSTSRARKELEDEIECAQMDTCKEYKKCKDSAQGKKRASRITKELEDGKVKDAFSSCSWNPEYYSDDAYKSACKEVFAAIDKVKDPEELRRMQYQCTGSSYDKMVAAYPDFSKVCGKIATVSYDKLMAKVIEARDGGKRDYSACHTLGEAAKVMDGGKEGDTSVKAKAACAEMNAAEGVTRGIAAAKDSIARKRTLVPYQCRSTVDELTKIGSAWAKTQKDELIKFCYVELGKVILEIEGKKDMKYYCPYAIKELVEAVEKYELATTQPDLGAAVKKLPALCSKKR